MWILNAIEWKVPPEIFSIGAVHVRYYGLLFAGGFMLSFYLVQKFYRDANIDPIEVDKLTIYTILGAVIGARFGHILFYEPVYFFNNPSEILKVWHGGLASHGGVIGILITTFLYSKKYKRPYLWVLDRIAIPSALTGGLIRIGNLMNSEIYGEKTDLPWGVIFRLNGETEPMHPTQIYESIAYFIVFGFLFWIYSSSKGKIQRGKIIGLWMIGVFSFRFFIEFFKNNQVAKEAEMAINIGQLLSIPMVIIGLALFLNSRKQIVDTFK